MKKILSNTKYFWLILISIFVISRLATWFFPYDSDHWMFFYVGKNWAEGGTLYLSAWDHKPPIIYALNALMFFCFNDNLALHRVFFTLYTIAGIYIFYLIAKQIFKNIFPKDAIYLTRLSTLLYVFWSNLSQFTNSGNNTENFGVLVLLSMIYIYLLYREKHRYWQLLVSGIGFAILFWLKPNMILLSLPIWVDMVFFDKSYIHFLTNLFAKLKYIIIFLIPWFALSIYWYIYFHAHNSYTDFLEASFYFSSRYMSAAWQGHVSVQNIFIVILVAFLVPFLLFIFIYLRNSYPYIKTQAIQRLLFFWILSALLYIAISGSFYTYYYLIVMPVLVLGMVASIGYIQSQKWLKILSAIFILAILSSYAISSKQLYNSFAGLVRISENHDRQVASYITQNSNPNDTILSYTYGATFYELTHRDAGTRYLSASHLLLDEREGFGFGITDKYIQDAEISKPVYLIYPNESYDRYKLYVQNKKAVEYLLSHYKLEKAFDDYSVYKRIQN